MNGGLPSARLRGHSVGTILAAWLALGGTSGVDPSGVLQHAEADARFVRGGGAMIVYTSEGIARVNLDGSGEKPIFRGVGLRVLDASFDLKTWVISDNQTNLLVGDASTGALRPVPALSRRLADAALSPDDRQIAATRHADFSLPQENWRDDDAVYLMDVDSALGRRRPAHLFPRDRLHPVARRRPRFATFAFEPGAPVAHLDRSHAKHGAPPHGAGETAARSPHGVTLRRP